MSARFKVLQSTLPARKKLPLQPHGHQTSERKHSFSATAIAQSMTCNALEAACRQELAGHPVSEACCDLMTKSDVLAACRSGAPCIASGLTHAGPQCMA